MKNFRLLSQLLAITAGILFFTSCQQEETLSNASIDERTTLIGSATNVNFFGLGPTNELYQYRSSPFTQLQATTISGLRDGELLLAIDSRPSTRQLYGITNQDALYLIRITAMSPFTAQAIKITIDSFKPSLDGSLRGMDFDPSSGNIKVVTDSGQNLNISPETGDVVAVDMAIGFHGGTVIVNSIAFQNTFTLTGPVLFNMDIYEGKLYKLNPATGGLTLVGPTGFSMMGEGGFDISSKGIGIATYETSSAKFGSVIPDPTTSLGNWAFNINLKTGAAARLGSVPPMIGIAIQ